MGSSPAVFSWFLLVNFSPATPELPAILTVLIKTLLKQTV